MVKNKFGNQFPSQRAGETGRGMIIRLGVRGEFHSRLLARVREKTQQSWENNCLTEQQLRTRHDNTRQWFLNCGYDDRPWTRHHITRARNAIVVHALKVLLFYIRVTFTVVN